MIAFTSLPADAPTYGSVLVVVADPVVRELIEASLKQARLLPILAASATEGRRLAGEVLPDAVLVDADAPATCDWCPGRDAGPRVTTLLLSSKRRPGAAEPGAEAASTVWLSKPFSPREVARQLAARLVVPHASRMLRCGRIEIDAELPEVHLHAGDGQVRTLHLPPAEARLLRVLVREQGRVVRRESFVAEVGQAAHPVALRTVDQVVRRLRRRLEGCGGISVQTVRGLGYRLQADATSLPPAAGS